MLMHKYLFFNAQVLYIFIENLQVRSHSTDHSITLELERPMS